MCMSSDPDRRYDWIEYEDGTFLGEGNTDQCISKIIFLYLERKYLYSNFYNGLFNSSSTYLNQTNFNNDFQAVASTGFGQGSLFLKKNRRQPF